MIPKNSGCYLQIWVNIRLSLVSHLMFQSMADTISMATPYYDKANETWKIKVKEDGKWKSRTLCKGEFADTPPDEILKLAAALAPVEVVQVAEATGDGLRAYSELYLKRHPSKRVNGVRRRESLLRRFCEFAEGRGWLTIDSVGVRQINDWVDHRQGVEKAGDATIVSDLAILQGLFRSAIEEGRISANPATIPAKQARKRSSLSGIDDEEQEEIKFYTREQQERIFSVLPLALPQYRDLVVLLLATGMRADAAIHMEASWLREGHLVRIPEKFDKGGAGYTTYLFGDEAKAVVSRVARNIQKDGFFRRLPRRARLGTTSTRSIGGTG